MDLEGITVSEISQAKTDKHQMVSYVESKVTELIETKNRLPEVGVGLWGMRSKGTLFQLCNE